MPSRIKMSDEPKMKTQDSAGVSLCSCRGTELDQVLQQFEELQPLEEFESPPNLCETIFPPPSPLGTLLMFECYEKGGFSRIDGQVEEWTTNLDIILEPEEEHMSLEGPKVLQLSGDIDRHVDPSVEEAEENIVTEELTAQVNTSRDTFKNSNLEMKKSGVVAGQDSIILPSDGNKSGEEQIISLPLFADECDEGEEECKDVPALIRQTSYYETNSTMPVVPSALHQEELLPPNQSETALRLGIQEAVQQVQRYPPLSNVAIELSNQGGAASEGTRYVAEQHRRAEERIDGKSQQTGAEEVKEETGLKPEQGGLLTHSTTVQMELKETEKYNRVSSRLTKSIRMESDDNQSDSGVSADFSPCNTLVSSNTVPTDNLARDTKETPIEREIRRAIEREHSLRRSRGLPHQPVSPEFVEIPLRKSVPSQSLVVKSERSQGKDFSGAMMQREIREETQREQDLVKLGKVPGIYDKGTVRQLKERKQLFEIFQQSKEVTPARSRTTSSISSSDFTKLKKKEDISPSTTKVGSSSAERRRSIDLLTEAQKQKGYQVIIIENSLSVPAQNHYAKKYSEQKQEEEVPPKENRFFKLRSSTALVKVEQDIKEAQEREKELCKQRTRLYAGPRVPGGGGGLGRGDKDGGGLKRPAYMDRRNLTLFPLSLNGLTDPGSSSRPGTGPSAVLQSLGTLAPAQAEKEPISQPEILKSPQAPKQKTLLVQH
ncbi:uncharacterized protein LOC117526513 [Thalassophryne amazonica]|uniref:uncharacterized protein LOC117526513 n=1 Tax=Thalassophryne amazonica TaxID=390379 RepID=UPI00147136E6|nr:uncharacterized protein LOC117526513 [Thalassophryne amazonica]